MEELVRPKFRRRRRWVTAMLALAVVAHAVVIYVLLTRPDPPPTHVTTVERHETTHVVPMPTPIVVPMTIEPPSPPVPAVCPTPRTDAPRFTPPALPEAVTELAVSTTNAGWIAAYNDHAVYVSTDAGKTFARVLDGPGEVHDVAFDCFGTVIVARGTQVGIREGDHERWREVAGLDTTTDGATLIDGGREIIVVSRSAADERGRVAISADRGAQWRYHDFAPYFTNEAVRGVQRADGTILVGAAVTDCMTEDLYWAKIENGEVLERTLSLPGTIQWQFYGDKIYAGNATRGFAADEAEAWKQVQHASDTEWYGAPIQGPRPVLVGIDPHASVFDGTKRRELPWVIERDDHDVVAMDPAGRIWSVVCGQPWIATKAPSGRACDGIGVSDGDGDGE